MVHLSVQSVQEPGGRAGPPESRGGPDVLQLLLYLFLPLLLLLEPPLPEHVLAPGMPRGHRYHLVDLLARFLLLRAKQLLRAEDLLGVLRDGDFGIGHGLLQFIGVGHPADV